MVSLDIRKSSNTCAICMTTLVYVYTCVAIYFYLSPLIARAKVIVCERCAVRYTTGI